MKRRRVLAVLGTATAVGSPTPILFAFLLVAMSDDLPGDMDTFDLGDIVAAIVIVAVTAGYIFGYIDTADSTFMYVILAAAAYLFGADVVKGLKGL